MTSTEIAKFETGKFLVLQHEPEEVQAMMKRILGDETINESELPRVGIPAGGGRTWEVPDGRGGVESTSDLQGIIVHHKTTRAYWPSADPSGEPPQCRSENGLVGIGDPGGNCSTCQFGGAGWGSGKNGRGQACSLYHVLFLLPPGGDFLPLVVRLPATSAIVMKREYLVGVLARKMLPPERLLTSLKLKRTENADGQPFSIVEPSIVAELDDEEAARALAYAEAFRPLFDAAARAVTVSDETVDGTVAATAEEEDLVARAAKTFGDEPAF